MPMGLTKFEELEEKVNQLLKGFEELEMENGRLRASLEEKDRSVRELAEKVERSHEEKVQVRDRVDILLTRLDTLIQKT